MDDSANNTTSAKKLPLDDCHFSDSTLHGIQQTFYFVYAVLCPIYTVGGLAGNCILLAAFWKQRKSEAPYTYQVALTVGKAVEVFLCGTFWMGLKMGLGDYGMGGGLMWFKKGYFLVWYIAIIGFAISALCWVLTLLLSVAMTADRVFSLWKPFIYRNIKHSRHQAIAIISCIVIAILNVPHGFMFNKVVEVDDHYEIGLKVDVLESLYFRFMVIVNQSTRVIGIILLVISNCMLVTFYRAFVKQSFVNQDDDRSKQLTEADRILFLLSLRQSVLTCVGQIPHIFMIYVKQTSVFLEVCAVVTTPIADGLIMITDMIDFFVVLSINRGMRDIIWKAFPCFDCASKTPVTAIQQSGAQKPLSEALKEA